MKEIIVASTNEGKIREIKAMLEDIGIEHNGNELVARGNAAAGNGNAEVFEDRRDVLGAPRREVGAVHGGDHADGVAEGVDAKVAYQCGQQRDEYQGP